MAATAPRRPASCSPTPRRAPEPRCEALLDEGFARRCDPDRRPLRARNAPPVRTPRSARRDPRTDRTRDFPALRALNDRASGEELRRTRPRTRRPAAPARWREWMGRVEAVVFASARPVLREDLVPVVRANCNIDLILDDIRDELRGHPFMRSFRSRAVGAFAPSSGSAKPSEPRSAGQQNLNCRRRTRSS